LADFGLAIPTVLRHEGGFVNNPNDPGGATKYGVSLRYLKTLGLEGDYNHDGHVDVEDIRGMNVEEAKDIFRKHWWDAFGYGDIVDQKVATKVFDTCVNVGSRQAHKILQKSLCAIGQQVVVDGMFGPGSKAATNAADAIKLFPELQIVQAAFYRELVQQHPKFLEFLQGWLNRAYDRT
jgi:lysozyme family protein